MSKKNTSLIWVLFGMLVFAFPVFAQMKSRSPAAKSTPPPAQPATDAPVETPSEKVPVKKNERPGADEKGAAKTPVQQELEKKNSNVGNQASAAAAQNNFRYEFSQPDFIVSHAVIEHDETGRGTITFEEKMSGALTDPIQMSAATLEKIKNLFQALNFVDSTEDYQSTKYQYPHLGTVKIRYKKDGRARSVEYNWTENKDAKALANEYYKLVVQYVWLSNIKIARENQPLNAPGLLDALDSYIKLNEISDPPQMIPFLKDLSNDERIPLIARNHAARIIKIIEKKSK